MQYGSFLHILLCTRPGSTCSGVYSRLSLFVARTFGCLRVLISTLIPTLVVLEEVLLFEWRDIQLVVATSTQRQRVLNVLHVVVGIVHGPSLDAELTALF